jgi:hypothetical protein
MSAANLDAADLAAVALGGLIKEAVMDRIEDLSQNIPLLAAQTFGKGSVGNAKFSWTLDKLADPVIDDQVVDGSDTSGDDTSTGERVQNFCEERVKVVRVSKRANASETIGFARALAYQVMMRQKELRRNVDATVFSNNASQADDGNTTPGVTAGLDAWLETNTSNGADTGANGGFNPTTGIVDAYTPGTKRALSESVFKDLLQSVFEAGGESMTVMCRPSVARIFSEYQFTAGARIATLTSEAGQEGKATAVGAVNVYIGDFAVVTIKANRLQPQIAAGVSTMFILDPSLVSLVYLQGYQVAPLATTGLADNRLMSVDWGLRVGNEAGLAAFRDIDETLPMVA